MNIRKICEKHLVDCGLNNEKYNDRLNIELEVIEKYNLQDYFFIVADIINMCKRKNWFVSPGRGSAGGSLTCYLLGMTEIDPLKYDLLFSRFLNETRVTKGDASSMPDIDFDVPKSKRQEVIEYLQEKYGEDKVFLISNYNYFTLNSAIRKVISVSDFETKSGNMILKNTIIEKGDTLESVLKNKENTLFFKYYNSDKEFKQICNIADKMNGNVSNPSIHASGVVIFDEDVSNIFPLRKIKNTLALQGDKKDVENMGGVKIDLLGLSTCDLIQDIVKEIGMDWRDLYSIDLEDPEIYKMIQKGIVTGCFQIGTPEMKKCLIDIKCNCFEDLIAAVALIRPGSKKFIPNYANVKLNNKNILDEIPYFKDILEIVTPTYGIILFQEQFMEISKVLSGFSDAEADVLRKAIGKKNMELMESLKEKFIANAPNEKDAIKIWTAIEMAAEYSFNKSHSVAYALLGFFTAYLKYHYPEIFMKYALIHLSTTKENLSDLLRNSDIPIKPPALKFSKTEYTINNGNIYIGLGDVKNVRKKTMERIIENTIEKENLEKDNFLNMIRFMEKVKMDKATFDALNKSGLFSEFFNMGKLIQCSEFLFKELGANKTRKKSKKDENELADFFSFLYNRELSSEKKDDINSIVETTGVIPDFPEDKKNIPQTNFENYQISNKFQELGYVSKITVKKTKTGNDYFLLECSFKHYSTVVRIFREKKIEKGFYFFFGFIGEYMGKPSLNINKVERYLLK